MTLDARFDAALSAAKRGDPGAIEAIYLDTAPLVLGYLRAQRAPDPEDLTSDVFVSMIASIATFDGDEGRFRSWLLTIAHRRMVDAMRRRGRRPEDPTTHDGLHEVGWTHPGAEEAAMERLRANGIIEVIDGLTEDQRAVLLLLRVVADLPVRDVAVVIGKPETAVKALLRRAVASVRRRMDELEPGSAGGSAPYGGGSVPVAPASVDQMAARWPGRPIEIDR